MRAPPSEYLPRWPSLRTTRWHGIRSGTGFFASAVPAARTALGMPDLLGDPAVGPHLAGRDLESLQEHRPLELGEPAQVEPQLPASLAADAGARAPARRPAAPTSPDTPGVRSAARSRARTRRRTSPASPSRCPPCCAPRTPGPSGDSSRQYVSARPTRRSTAGSSVSGAFGLDGIDRRAFETASDSLHPRHDLTPSRRDSDRASRRALIPRCTFDFDRAERLAEHRRDLLETEAFDVTKLRAAARYRSGRPAITPAMSCRSRAFS